MGLIIDGVIILFILASIFFGYKKGLISLGINLVAFIITIVAVMVFYRPIGNIIINTTTIDEKIQETIEENVGEMIQTENTNEITSELVESAKQGMLPEASKELARNIVYGATMLILFIGIRIALIFVTAIANFVAKLPILDQFNKAGGAIYGALRGFLVTYAILIIINLIVTMNPTGTSGNTMNTSYIAKTMTTYNILNIFF